METPPALQISDDDAAQMNAVLNVAANVVRNVMRKASPGSTPMTSHGSRPCPTGRAMA